MSCSGDFDCKNTMACSNSVCVNYGSIENYEPSNNLLACKSGFYGQITEQDSTNQSQNTVCLPTPTLISDEKC